MSAGIRKTLVEDACCIDILKQIRGVPRRTRPDRVHLSRKPPHPPASQTGHRRENGAERDGVVGIAAFAMTLTSLFVVTHSAGLRRFDPAR